LPFDTRSDLVRRTGQNGFVMCNARRETRNAKRCIFEQHRDSLDAYKNNTISISNITIVVAYMMFFAKYNQLLITVQQIFTIKLLASNRPEQANIFGQEHSSP
jgi:hypothetical protein